MPPTPLSHPISSHTLHPPLIPPAVTYTHAVNPSHPKSHRLSVTVGVAAGHPQPTANVDVATGVVPPTSTGRHRISSHTPTVLATVFVTVGQPVSAMGRVDVRGVVALVAKVLLAEWVEKVLLAGWVEKVLLAEWVWVGW